MHRRLRVLATTMLAATVATACLDADDGEPDLSPDDYRSEMNAVCTTSIDRLAALPTPPDEISDADFAIEVSRAIRDEAADAAAIRPPDDVRADHLSFVENTEDQSAAWSELSTAMTDPQVEDDIDRLRTEILELSLGRNDLASEMGLTGCTRGR